MTASTIGLRPRPVFCVTGDAYRRRAVADEVCDGQFTECGVTLKLGLEPDWTGSTLPRDKEWRIAWVKFYYGLDLAHAFGETGDPRYLRAWESLVSSWIEQVPAGQDSSDVAARRVQNWIYAWDRFASAPGFPGLADGLGDRIAASIAGQIAHIRVNLTPARNHRTLELYALFIAALAFRDEDLLGFSMEGLHENLLAEVRPDGVHVEQSSHYHLIVLRSFVGARENARRYGLRFPREFDERLARACEFAWHCHRPDGGIAALSDSDGGSYVDLLRLAASLLDRPDLGSPPAGGASFPDGGYFTQRSGPGTDARFLIFDCGPLGAGGHGHYDLLSIEVAAGGRALLMDPGRYTYAEDPGGQNMRHWFKGTAAHNTVIVDALDQTPYARGAPRGPVAEGRFLGRLTAPGLDVLCGEARSPCYDAVHRRRVALVADEYWIVEDRLRAERPHRYDLRLHLGPEAWDATELAGMAVMAPGLALVFDAPVVPLLEPGWVSPLYGEKLNAPVVSVAAQGTADAIFTTLIMPLEPGLGVPGLRVRPDGEIEVAGPGWRDSVRLGPRPRWRRLP